MHSRQAVAEAWKAFHFRHAASFSKTHNLRELGKACVALDGSLEVGAERAGQLTALARVFRYSGEPQELSPGEVGEALAIARQAHKAVLADPPEGACP